MKIRVAVVLVSTLFVASACGGGDSPESGAADEVDATSFMPDLIAEMRKEGSVSINMEITGPDALQMEGDMVLGKGTSSDAEIRVDADGEEFAIRAVDGRTWIAYDSLTAGRFFELDTENGTEAEKGFAGLASQMDPTASFTPFANAVDSVEKDGKPAVVAGVKSQKYRVVVDTSRIKGLPELDALPDSQVPETFTYDFWVDNEGLLRHVEFEVGGFGLKGDYLDYGKTTSIDVPTGPEITTDNPFESAA